MLVVDAKGFLEAGPWGDVLTVAAMKIGVAGLVINGAVRDASTIVEMGFPVFCRGLSIKGTGKVQPGKVNVPVCVGDVVIRPGDIILGDRDGLVVVSPDEVASVLESARAREAKENEFRSAIEKGASTVELLGLSPTLERLDSVDRTIWPARPHETNGYKGARIMRKKEVKRPSKELIEGFLQVSTCNVSDALDKLGMRCGIGGIRPAFNDCPKIVGPAITMRIIPFGPEVPTGHMGVWIPYPYRKKAMLSS